MTGDSYVTPSIAMESAKMVTAILDGIARGKMQSAMARELGVSIPTVARIVKELADEARRRNRERVEEAMMAQDVRLERLYRYCIDRIEKAEGFDRDAIRLAILVCERQAKLLGLDKVKAPGGPQGRDWMTDMPDSELIREAKRLNIKIPERFLAPVGTAATAPDA